MQPGSPGGREVPPGPGHSDLLCTEALMRPAWKQELKNSLVCDNSTGLTPAVLIWVALKTAAE